MLGFLTPVVELFTYPLKKGVDGVVRVVSSTADGVKTAITDGYHRSTSRAGVLLDKAGNIIYNGAGEARTGMKNLGGWTYDKTAQALDASRHTAGSLAKYGWEKGSQTVDMVGGAVKKGAQLAGDLSGKAFDATKGAFAKDPATGRTADYVPERKINPFNQVGEMFVDLGVEAQELIESTQDKLVNTFNFLFEGKRPPKPQLQPVRA